MSDEQLQGSEDEYEEITSDEVDRVVEALDALAETVASENIRAILEDASSDIFSLVYDESDLVDDEETDGPMPDAA